MKRFMAFAVSILVLTLAMTGCNGGGTPPSPTPTAVPPTATPDPTNTPIPATPTPIPPTPIPTATPIAPTSDPNVESYRLPKMVGVNQIAYSEAWPYPRHGGVLDQFTTKELFDELSSYGIRAVRLFLSVRPDDGVTGPPIYEDMSEVWGHPGIDTIVVLFTHPAFITRAEPGCVKTRVGWEINEPTYEIATFLYENFPDEEKTIIFTEQEIDNLARGYDCEEPNDAIWHMWDKSAECRLEKTDVECAREFHAERLAAAIERAQNRQIAVMRARAEHPDAKLLVATSITVSLFDENEKYFNKFALRDGIPDMDPSVDFLGMSQGASGGRDFAFPIQQIRLYTGFPMDRIFVDQVYVNEKYPGVQYNLIGPAIRVAFNWDVQTALIWMWKQGWRGTNDRGQPENKGMWQWANEVGRMEYGDPTSGMDVIRELNPEWIEPTPTPEPTNTPVDTPTPEPTPTPDADPCAECPPPGSMGCTISYSLCVQCWEDCGQPIEPTPTPIPVTPTPTPTGGVILPTPTPMPEGCDHCPDPNSFGCVISPPACEQCWRDCGQPLATPTPRDTPTPTPTPLPPTHATISVTAEGSPTHCTWVATNEDSGLQVAHDVPECAEFLVSFPEVGWWMLEMTAHYMHGYTGVQDPCLDNEGVAIEDAVCGDLDADGWYEFRTFEMIEVLEAPEVPIIT